MMSRKDQRILTIMLCIIAGFVAIFGGNALVERARADGTEFWVMCQPGDWVNARSRGDKAGQIVGTLETGDSVYLDGKTRNGYCHMVRATFETNEAWVFAGYVSDEKPVDMGGATYQVVTNGRVACRKYMDGPRRCWVVNGSEVKVYYMTSTWAVTNKGFIKSEYLQVKEDAADGNGAASGQS